MPLNEAVPCQTGSDNQLAIRVGTFERPCGHETTVVPMCANCVVAVSGNRISPEAAPCECGKTNHFRCISIRPFVEGKR